MRCLIVFDKILLSKLFICVTTRAQQRHVQLYLAGRLDIVLAVFKRLLFSIIKFNF